MNKLFYDLAFSNFCRLAKLSVDNGQEYSCLCQNAVSETLPLLKTTQLSEEEKNRVAFLIAVTALEKYLLLNTSLDSSVSQKLGDTSVSVDPSLSLSSVRELKKQAKESCRELVLNAGCVFKVM